MIVIELDFQSHVWAKNVFPLDKIFCFSVFSLKDERCFITDFYPERASCVSTPNRSKSQTDIMLFVIVQEVDAFHEVLTVEETSAVLT